MAETCYYAGLLTWKCHLTNFYSQIRSKNKIKRRRTFNSSLLSRSTYNQFSPRFLLSAPSRPISLWCYQKHIHYIKFFTQRHCHLLLTASPTDHRWAGFSSSLRDTFSLITIVYNVGDKHVGNCSQSACQCGLTSFAALLWSLVPGSVWILIAVAVGC